MASSFRRANKSISQSGAGKTGNENVAVNRDNTLPSSTREAQTTSTSSLQQQTSTTLPSTLRGTKPWTGGVTLTSVGLRELDLILGNGNPGGQPLGSCVLIEEDRFAPDLTNDFVRYWCSEGISQNQILLIPTTRGNEIEGSSGDEGYPSLLSTPPPLVDDEDGDRGDLPKGITMTDEIQDILQTLPRNLHRDKKKKKEIKILGSKGAEGKQSGGEIGSGSRQLTILEEEEGDNNSDGDGLDQGESVKSSKDNEEGLNIAWQYRKSVQDERSGRLGKSTDSLPKTAKPSNDNIYCHSYDLSGRMSHQREAERKDNYGSEVHIVNCLCCCNQNTPESYSSPRKSGHRLYQSLLKELKHHLTKANNCRVVRLMLHHVHANTATCLALQLLLTYIRANKLPVVTLVSIQPWRAVPSDNTRHNNQSNVTSLRRVCDVVLQPQGFVSKRNTYPPPSEFQNLHGLLLIPKVSTVTGSSCVGHYADMTITKRPTAQTYGLRRDRRKLHISLLHIPPEEFSQNSSSVGSTAVRTGGGRPKQQQSKPTAKISGGGGSCAAGSSSLLDF